MDFNSNTNWVLTVLLLPVLATIFRAELAKLWFAWCIYNDRPFDLDRNPGTPDPCMTFNPATGTWGLVVIHRYSFWKLRSVDRGVWFSHVTGDGNKLRPRHVGLIEWGQLQKAELERPIDADTRRFLNRYQIG